MVAASGSGEERGRGYTEQATEDLLFRVLEKEFREAMQDVLEDRRKITDPDVCNLFNLWYLRSHVDGIQEEMRAGFAGLRQDMEARFEKVDAQFAGLRQDMDKRFEKTDERFEKIDERFEKIDERFEKMDERFEKMEHRISMIFTFLSAGFTILAALITLFQFLD